MSRPGFDAKPAVLLALMDVCVEHSTRAGSAPSAITTPQLARKIVELYWPQTTPCLATVRVLRQYQGRGDVRASQAEIVRHILEFREWNAPDPTATLHDARRTASRQLERLERDVEWALIANPLTRLQRRGRDTDRFLYEIGWDETVRRGDTRAAGFDNRILFVDEGRAGDRLLALAPLVRPLAQHRWTSLVAQWNRELPGLGEAVELERFLFGEERVALARVTAPLIA